MEKKHQETLKPKERNLPEPGSPAGGEHAYTPSRPHVRSAMLDFDGLGRGEGKQTGPKPGNGAVLHQCSGEADFDGLPGDKPPPPDAVKRKLNEDATAPPERFAD